MPVFSLVFLVAIALHFGLELLLASRQRAWVLAHRDGVPSPFASAISLEEHQRATDYTRAKVGFAMVAESLDTLLVLAWTLGGGIALLQTVTAALPVSELWRGTLLLVGFALVSGVVSLPLSVWRTFRIEARFGFNRTTPKLFVVDRLKGLVLLVLLGLPLALVVLFLMERAGHLWWLYVWAVWTGFGLLLSWAYPRLIAPLFNRFKPLDAGPLRERIDALLARTGFVGGGVFVIDGSRRSSHGNAYFSGFGRAKKIAIFDTLLERLSETEVEAVLAHELGHFRLRHVAKGLVLNAAMSLAGLALLGYLVSQPWFYAGLGVATPSLAAALLLFLLAGPHFTVWLHPLVAAFSRRHEREADVFAAQHASPQELASALVALYRDNHAALSSDPWHSLFFDSHPAPLERIEALDKL